MAFLWAQLQLQKTKYLRIDCFIAQVWLHQNNIRLVVNCCEHSYQLKDASIEVVRHNVLYHGNLSILDHVNKINKRIQEAVDKGNNVLIHCTLGQTRSCSCAICYFIWRDRCSYDEAYKLVESHRPEIDIPYQLELYLREYENQLIHGSVNKDIDRVEPNCHIELAVEDGANSQTLVSKIKELSSEITLCGVEKRDGFYGGSILGVNAFVPDSLQTNFEDTLQELYQEQPVRSVHVVWIDEFTFC